jgi:ABC-2 type transport system ATP-binding protein
MNCALDIKDLHKTYRNGFVALNGVDLHVDQGDFFALLGPNGAGKSTIIGIITSLVNKSSGKASIYGYDIDTHFAEAKAHIGVLPQEYNFNVWEPVEEILVNQAGYYGIDRKDASRRAEHWLKKLDLWDKRKDTARNLSGGMKRRMMIARALMHDPRLLILDEPTAGVDIENRRAMWEFLVELNKQGTTIILTTHYLEEAENLCRNIAIIERGKVIEHTSTRELINRLGSETFILDVKQALDEAPHLNCHAVRLIDSHTLEVDVDKHTGITNLFDELGKLSINVQNMRNKTNRLEQLFLEMLDEGNAA